MTVMKQLEAEIGEMAQALNILEEAIATKNEAEAKQIYSMILYHIAHKYNPKLIESLDKMMEKL